MTAPAEAGPGRGSVTVIAPGAASLAVRGPVTGPRQELRVIAADACAVYLELPAGSPEPRVIVLSAADVPRLPNAIALISRPDPPAPGGFDRIAMGADRPGADHTGANRPRTGRPRTGRPETGRPETGRPETGRPETGRPGAADSRGWAADSADCWAADGGGGGRGAV